MRASTRRWVALAAALVILISSVVIIEPLRSSAARTLFSAYLATKGLHLARAEMHVDGHHLDVRDLTIVDGQKRPVAALRSLSVGYALHGGRLAVQALELDGLHLVVRRAADGSFDLARAVGSGGGGNATPASGRTGNNAFSMRGIVRVRDGAIDFENQFAPARLGRAFALRSVNASFQVNTQGVSTGRFRAMLAARRQSAILGTYRQDAALGIGDMQATVRHADIAPPLDYFISSPDFVAEDGASDVRVHAYAVGPTATWNIAADGAFQDVRLRVVPLIVPVRDVHGPFTFVDNILVLHHFSGSAAAIPMSGRGSITLAPSPWLDLTVASRGSLTRVRKLLAFTKPLSLHGDVAFVTRILGAPTDPQIGIGFIMRRGWQIANTPLGWTDGALVYHHGHATIPSAYAQVSGIAAYATGDIDVGSAGPPTGQLIAYAGGRSASIPWVTNLDRAGDLSARVAFSGSLAQPDIGGYVELGGQHMRARGTFHSDPAALSVGPLLASDRRGGTLVARAQVLQRPDHPTSGSFIADHFAFDLNDRHAALPGIVSSPVGTSAMSGLVDGIAVAAGQRDALLFDMDMHVGRLVANGGSYGDTDVEGSGALRQRPRGQVLAAVRLRHAGGTALGGTPAAVNAVVGLTGTHIRLYSANGNLAGGSVALTGDLQLGSRVPTDLLVWANHIQLAGVGVRTPSAMHGEITALGRSTALGGHAGFDVSAIARGLTFAGRPVSGDAELSYDGSTLATRDSQVLIGSGSAIDLSGAVRGLTSPASLSQAQLDLDARMRHADMAELASLSSAAPELGGGIDATAHIGGLVGSPSVRGVVSSDYGTLRGVAFENVQASVAAAPGAIEVDSAQATIGSSRLRLSGRLSGAVTSVALASPYVDLADFNDFFGGKDVFAGTGSADMALRIGPSFGYGAGSLHLSDVAIEHVPLGTVQARLALPDRGRVALDVRSDGAVGSSTIVATVGYRPIMSFAASQATTYNLSADLHDIEISDLGAILPPSAQGLRGRLNLHANAWGTPGALHGNAAFRLVDGFINKDRIDDLSGALAADDRGIEVQRFHGSVAGLDLSASGMYSQSRHFSAHARLSTADVAQLERITAIPPYVQGPAALDIDASGTAASPLAHARLSADKGTALGVAYERASADMTYRRGALAVKDATVSLAAKRGTLALQGTLPVSLGHQAPIVKSRPALHLQFSADRVNLAALDPLTHGKATLEGEFNARAVATGSLARPQFSGAAHVRGGNIRSGLETIPLSKLDADATFQQDAVALERLHGVLGRGTVDASGTARFEPSPDSGLSRAVYNVHLTTRRADLSVPQYFTGVVDANFGINTETAKPQVNSDVIISDADIPFAGILALASGSSPGNDAQTGPVPGVPPYRKGHTIVYGGQIYGTGNEPHVVQPTPTPMPRKHITYPLALNVDASAGDNVQVTGLVNATGSGTVHVGGTEGAPKMSGDLSIIRGTASLFDTTFHLVRGGVAFHPSDGLLPTVGAEAIAFRPEADVTARVYGRVDHLHTELESDPPMSEQDILANILHIGDINASLSGTPNGSGTPQANAGASLGRIAGGVAAAPLLNALNFGLERTLHLEEVDVAFDQNGQPTIEVRKQYGKNLFAVFRSSFASPPDEAAGVVYEPRNGLELSWFTKQNTAGQTYTQQGQYQTWQVLYRFPNKQGFGRKPRPSSQAKLTPVNLGF